MAAATGTETTKWNTLLRSLTHIDLECALRPDWCRRDTLRLLRINETYLSPVLIILYLGKPLFNFIISPTWL